MAARIYLPEKVYVAPSPIHGYGCFAKSKIYEGEIIEECPVFDLNIYKNDTCWHILEDYRFLWPSGSAGSPLAQVMPAGYGAIYNHSNNPNATWKSSTARNTFFFYALRDIDQEEEIFTYYGGSEYWGDGNRMKMEDLK